MDKTVYLFKYWCFLWQVLIHVEQAGTETPEALQSLKSEVGRGGKGAWIRRAGFVPRVQLSRRCRSAHWRRGRVGGVLREWGQSLEQRKTGCDAATARLGYPPPTFAMALSQYGFAPLWSAAFRTTTIVNGCGAPITGLHASPWNYSGVGIWVALSFICDLQLHFYIFQYQGGN